MGEQFSNHPFGFHARLGAALLQFITTKDKLRRARNASDPSASLALPCACWVSLYRHEVPKAHSAAALALALVAAVAGMAFTAVDIMKLGSE